MSDLVTRSDDDGLCTLTLNRPDKLNALNVPMFVELRAHVDRIAGETETVGCVVLRGAGRAFSAGHDLKDIQVGEQPPHPHFQAETVACLANLPQPVITAVHRVAVGAGMALANASDIVVASKGTRFINAFIKIGFSGADCGSSYFLPRILGFHRSAELLYSGRDLSAEEAHGWGYVNFLVEIVNDHGSSPIDNYLLVSYNNQPLSATRTISLITWQLDDTTAEALDSTELGLKPPVLDDWESPFGLNINGEDTEGMGYMYLIRAQVTQVSRGGG